MNVWMRRLRREPIGYSMFYTRYTPTEWYVMDDFGTLIQVN